MDYTSTQYAALVAQNFWGQLLDERGYPNETLRRFSDALFFYVDAHADVPAAYRKSGFIEPMKWAWMSSVCGNDKTLSEWMASKEIWGLYQLAGIPIKSIQLPNGTSVPVLDQRGLLHLIVWEFRTDPVTALLAMNKELALFSLVDPSTSQPFPQPVSPSSILGRTIDPVAKSALTRWQTQAIMNMNSGRDQARLQAIYQARNAVSGIPQVQASSVQLGIRPPSVPPRSALPGIMMGPQVGAGIGPRMGMGIQSGMVQVPPHLARLAAQRPMGVQPGVGAGAGANQQVALQIAQANLEAAKLKAEAQKAQNTTNTIQSGLRIASGLTRLFSD